MKRLPIIRPPRLRKGDAIGIISPAGPVKESELQPGLRFLEQSGFSVRLGPHALDRKGYLAGDDPARLDDLHAMFRDPEVRAVCCTRGGYGTMRILDRIQYDLIRKNPKVLAGFSDITALLLSVFAKAGLLGFHGPMVRQINDTGVHAFAALLEILGSSEEQRLQFPQARILLPGKAEGVLLGGNLCLISHLVGTPYLPPLKRCILFLEDRGEPLYRIDRMLTHLRLSGHLEGISAVVAGQFEECGEPGQIDAVLFDRTKDLGIPVISGIPLGHGALNVSLPVGGHARLDTAGPSLHLMEPCVL